MTGNAIPTIIDRYECSSCGAGGHRMTFMGDHMCCERCGDEWSEDPADGLRLPSAEYDTVIAGYGDLVTYRPHRGFSDDGPVEVLRVNRRTITVASPRWGRMRIDGRDVLTVTEPT